MSTTPTFGLTLLEIGQKDKEVTINTNMQLIDSKVPKYLGELNSDPVTTSLPFGTTYYNLTTSKLRVLLTSATWANAA